METTAFKTCRTIAFCFQHGFRIAGNAAVVEGGKTAHRMCTRHWPQLAATRRTEHSRLANFPTALRRVHHLATHRYTRVTKLGASQCSRLAQQLAYRCVSPLVPNCKNEMCVIFRLLRHHLARPHCGATSTDAVRSNGIELPVHFYDVSFHSHASTSLRERLATLRGIASARQLTRMSATEDCAHARRPGRPKKPSGSDVSTRMGRAAAARYNLCPVCRLSDKAADPLCEWHTHGYHRERMLTEAEAFALAAVTPQTRSHGGHVHSIEGQRAPLPAVAHMHSVMSCVHVRRANLPRHARCPLSAGYYLLYDAAEHKLRVLEQLRQDDPTSSAAMEHERVCLPYLAASFGMCTHGIHTIACTATRVQDCSSYADASTPGVHSGCTVPYHAVGPCVPVIGRSPLPWMNTTTWCSRPLRPCGVACLAS